MELSKQLIQKFFDKQCTTEEAEQVSMYLSQNPKILDQYLNQAEWDATNSNDKSDLFWDEMWDKINPEPQKKPVIIWLKKLAVAASIIGILGFTGWFFFNHGATKNQTTVSVIHRVINNNGTAIKTITLVDGSVVSLSPNSSISVDQPFQQHTRSIALTGEAVFKVAKDKSKPFIVTSGAISTTALGTVFKVTAHTQNTFINVQLYEGKVVVKAVNPIGNFNDMYLLPGDVLRYNKAESLASITSATKSKANGSRSTNSEVWLSFKKASLADVFDQLAAKYHTPIRYTNNEIAHLYYIGNFEKTDSLPHILATIAKLNNLTIVKDNIGTGYTVSK